MEIDTLESMWDKELCPMKIICNGSFHLVLCQLFLFYIRFLVGKFQYRNENAPISLSSRKKNIWGY